VLALGGLITLYLGLVRMLMFIGSWVGAILAALWAQPYVRDYARELITMKWLADGVAFIALFIIILIALTIVTHAIAQKVKNSPVSGVDRLLGLAFGVCLGAVTIVLAFMIWDSVAQPKEDPEWFAEARSAPYIRQGVEFARSIMPSGLESDVRKRLDDAEQTVTDKAAEEAGRRVEESIKGDGSGAESPTESNGSGDSEEKPDSTGDPGYKDADREKLDDLIRKSE
jgi:membrane protein required for colicin V production